MRLRNENENENDDAKWPDGSGGPYADGGYPPPGVVGKVDAHEANVVDDVNKDDVGDGNVVGDVADDALMVLDCTLHKVVMVVLLHKLLLLHHMGDILLSPLDR